jgi:hypothetical protein
MHESRSMHNNNVHTWNVMRLATKSEAGPCTKRGNSDGLVLLHCPLHVTTVEVAFGPVPTREIPLLFTTTFSLYAYYNTYNI